MWRPGRTEQQWDRNGRRHPMREQSRHAVSGPFSIRGRSRITNQRQGSETPRNHQTGTECETAFRTHHSEYRLVYRPVLPSRTSRNPSIGPLRQPSTDFTPNPLTTGPLTHFSDRNRTTATECEKYNRITDTIPSKSTTCETPTDDSSSNSLAGSRAAHNGGRRPTTPLFAARASTTRPTLSATTADSSVLSGLSADCDVCSGNEQSFRDRSRPLDASRRV